MAAVLAATLFGVCCVGSVNAGLLTANYSGTLTSVPVELMPQFAVGQTVTGSYTFESTTTARAGSTSNAAFFDALTNASYSAGTYTATTTGAPEIQVDNDVAGNDRYGVVSSVPNGLTGAAVNGIPLLFASIRLDDSTGTVFNNALNLPTSIDLNDFDSNEFILFFGAFEAETFVVSGELTSFEITGPSAVPEPSSFFLASIGVVGLAVAGYRKRRARNL
ncbi:PEP-CTERM sorting domain-containing protein [Symmachiella macrocystis]|uniref:PEP-CTERM sorting domain-containing protein n=1 Tax=Symmachiella macrocystis TaxID=2527985 RepID=UPI0011B5F2F1|nr:PEP-CTERM sorting domain-containing protein [Symmachiella macrocystis]